MSEGSFDSFLPAVIESMTDGVVVISDDGTVVYANRAAEALFGRSLPGTAFGYPVRDGEIGIARGHSGKRDGPPQPLRRVVEVRTAAVQWDGHASFVAVLRDVSQRRSLAVLTRQLAHKDKWAAIAQLTASIAHRINNPAAFMLANLTVMRDILGDFGAVFERTGIERQLLDRYQIPQSLRDMRAMLDDNMGGLRRIRQSLEAFRAMVRDDFDGSEPVDVSGAVAWACDIVAESLPDRVSLVRDFASVPGVMGDRLALIQLVGYLIDNAGRAASRVGSGIVEVSTSCTGPWIHVAVRDNGPGIGRGIRAEHIEIVFEPFFASRAGEGAAPGDGAGGDPAKTTTPDSAPSQEIYDRLGLAIAAELANRFGGRIEVTSQEEHGNEFRLLLPRSSRRIPVSEQPSSAPDQVRARILFIGDDDRLGQQICEMLGDAHDVIDAGGSAAALEHIARDSDYDLLFFDLAATAIDPQSLRRLLSAREPRLATRLIYLGDVGQSARILQLVESSRAVVLSKPPTRSSLRDVVERFSR